MDRRFLCLVLVSVRVCARAAAAPVPWVQLTSPHFTLLTDSGEKDGRRIVDQFERMRWVFHILFPQANVDPVNPIVVLAVKNQKTFDTLEPAAYLAKGQMKLAGLFLSSSDKNYILLRLDAEFEHPYATIYHEYTHLQFAPIADWLPLWLNEGEAEFMQNTDIDGKDVRLGQPSADDILYLRENRLIPLPVLFAVDSRSPYYHEEQKGSAFYAESWALTHYLMVTDHENHTHRVNDYVTLLQAGGDPVAAAEKAFGDLKALESDLNTYVRTGQYKLFMMSSAPAPLDESAYKVETLTPSQSDAARADVLASVGRTDDAQALLDAVLKEDPNNAQAYATRGLLAYRAGDTEEALKWYGEAAQRGSQDFLAYFYFAMLSMNRMRGDSDNQDAQRQQIEASLRTAIRLNPRFAPAYDRLAAYYAAQHANLDEAHRLSLLAVQLDPASIAYRVNSASLLVEMDRESDALTVLQAAAKVARKPGDVAMVQDRIAEVQQLEATRAQDAAQAAAPKAARPDYTTPIVVNTTLKHPTMPVTGPKLAADGVIRGVTCSYPYQIEFSVEGLKGKTVALYDNDFSKIELSAIGVTISGDVNPCMDFEGKRARVQYVASSDKSVDGQVVAVELHK
jgi:tetratricopeptide (TPR) repeat protein